MYTHTHICFDDDIFIGHRHCDIDIFRNLTLPFFSSNIFAKLFNLHLSRKTNSTKLISNVLSNYMNICISLEAFSKQMRNKSIFVLFYFLLLRMECKYIESWLLLLFILFTQNLNWEILIRLRKC